MATIQASFANAAEFFNSLLDRLGNIYSYRVGSEQFEQHSFPKLPNQVEDYLKTGASVDGKRFRAYDVEYLNLSKMLAVSHEYFDIQLQSTRLAVSIIPIDDAGRPVGKWETVFLGDPEPNGPNENGAGRLAEEAVDKIHLSIGDYKIESPKVSQDPKSSFGKIIEIDLKTKATRVQSLGHRNPEGLLRTKSGALFSTEHGPKAETSLTWLLTEAITVGRMFLWGLTMQATALLRTVSQETIPATRCPRLPGFLQSGCRI